MKRRSGRAGKTAKCDGQIVVEYAILLAMFFGVALMLVLFLSVFNEAGWRAVSLLSLNL